MERFLTKGSTEYGHQDPQSGERPAADTNGEWSVEKSRELYQVRGWGTPYFDINQRGNVEVRPDPRRDTRIDLFELIHELQEKGNELPILIRFSDILDDRIRQLNE